ncbi:MAG: hypothetical protein ABIN69_05080 [Aestuariivirga sp.]
MANSGPTITTIKKLFAHSGNRCAFPRCTSTLFQGDTNVADVCHIKGANEGGARFDPSQPDNERHAEPNLVLMCKIHHAVIDDDEVSYTVERLREIKADHEAKASTLDDSTASAFAHAYQNWVNIGQTGGLAAQTVNAQTINFQNTGPISHADTRRVQAIEDLWNIIQNLGKEFGTSVFFDSILTAQEIKECFKPPQNNPILECVRELEDLGSVPRKLESAGTNRASQCRIFVSPKLWAIYYAVNVLYARSAMLITNSFKAHQFDDWRGDGPIGKCLLSVLPAEAVTEIKGKHFGGLTTALEYLHREFITESGLNQYQEHAPRANNGADSQPAKPLTADVGLGEALAFIASGKWGKVYSTYLMAETVVRSASTAYDEIRQAAGDGTVQVWGKIDTHGIYVKIDPDYWARNTINFMSLIEGEPKTELVSSNALVVYRELRVNRAQIERQWSTSGE